MEKRGHEGDGGGGARARTFNYYIIGGMRKKVGRYKTVRISLLSELWALVY